MPAVKVPHAGQIAVLFHQGPLILLNQVVARMMQDLIELHEVNSPR